MRLIDMHAFVFMPTHVHLLFTPLRNEAGNSYRIAKIMNGIKGASAHNKLLGRKGHLWQDESFDHVVRSDQEFDEKFLYIVANPVNAGLCRSPEEYPWLWRG